MGLNKDQFIFKKKWKKNTKLKLESIHRKLEKNVENKKKVHFEKIYSKSEEILNTEININMKL